ncbi:MAG: arginine deiminase family protein [Actinomycetota bacterium]|nr:arginine deiminase family protein [Actinomycetota bacterium]
MTGIQDQTGRLRRVYVRAPRVEDLSGWRAFGWRSEPDPQRMLQEHAAFRAELEATGAEVVCGETPLPGDPDAIYTYDPVLMADRGAILLRPGKEGRRREPLAVERDLAAAGVRIAGRLEAPATAEGGDMFWLDSRTLAVGRGYRTNDAGIAAVRELLPDVEVMAFDLPHLRGPQECLHLLSLLSPLDRDLVVAYPPLLPVRLMEALAERGVSIVEVPEEEFSTMGPNVLALAPRVALALEGNPETRRRMEVAGVEVRTYRGDEISRKGDGGPTCLTRPLLRG